MRSSLSYVSCINLLVARVGPLYVPCINHLRAREPHVLIIYILLAPAVPVGETEGAMDSTSVFFLASSFAYNFVRK